MIKWTRGMLTAGTVILMAAKYDWLLGLVLGMLSLAIELIVARLNNLTNVLGQVTATLMVFVTSYPLPEKKEPDSGEEDDEEEPDADTQAQLEGDGCDILAPRA